MNKIKIIDKPWGYEVIYHNCPLYCGKKLVIWKDLNLSYHRHRLKTETLLVEQGKIKYVWGPLENLKSEILCEGQSVDIFPNTLHQLVALEYSEVIEFSTQHFDDDSYRVTRDLVMEIK